MKEISEMSFEEAIAELENVVSKLDKGDVALEDSVTYYDRGAALKKHCEATLQKAEMKIQEITGAGTAKPADDLLS